MLHPWRDHPRLKGRFHPDHPDDLQVVVHDGGPRLTRIPPEVVWVTVHGMDGDVFRGRVLNQPHQLQTVRQGDEICFLMPENSPHPFLTTEKYLRERADWTIMACNKCGVAGLFDAPSDLTRAVFPNNPPGAVMEMFTALCPLCGGFQLVKSKSSAGQDDGAEAAPTEHTHAKRWWQFWK